MTKLQCFDRSVGEENKVREESATPEEKERGALQLLSSADKFPFGEDCAIVAQVSR